MARSGLIPEEYDEDTVGGWSMYFLDAFSPFGLRRLAYDPSATRVVHASIVPGTALAGMYMMGRLSTMSGQGFALRYYGIIKFKNLQTLGLKAFRARRFVGTAGLIAGAYYANKELTKSRHRNLGMEPVPGQKGVYTNPMSGGGNDDFYYPGKGLVDWATGG